MLVTPTPHILARIAPGARLDLDRLARAMAAELPHHGISTPLRLAHFLAQAAHETDGFRTLVEYGGVTYFARYDGRRDLGNVRAGDGARYRGRGIFQLTGRHNYRRFGKLLDIDLEAEPERAAEPEISVTLAALYWSDRDLNLYADRDDARSVTRRINGGINGLADRLARLARAKAAIADLAPPDVPLPGRRPRRATC